MRRVASYDRQLWSYEWSKCQFEPHRRQSNAPRTGRVGANTELKWRPRSWQPEARMVEHIVRIGPDLQSDASWIANVLPREKLVRSSPGPYSVFRLKLPNVPLAGWAKAASLNH